MLQREKSGCGEMRCFVSPVRPGMVVCLKLSNELTKECATLAHGPHAAAYSSRKDAGEQFDRCQGARHTRVGCGVALSSPKAPVLTVR